MFHKMHVEMLLFYDQTRGIAWTWSSLDSAIVKAPKGGTRQGIVSKTLDAVPLYGSRGPRRPEHLCLDKGYDYADTEKEVRQRHIRPHIRRGESQRSSAV